MDVLECIYLSLRNIEVQRAAVDEFGMYNRCGDGVSCVEIEIGTNAA